MCLSPGEIVVNEVNFVRKCISAESSQDDLWGKLICTNFKVSFIPQDASSKQVFVCFFEYFLFLSTLIRFNVLSLWVKNTFCSFLLHCLKLSKLPYALNKDLASIGYSFSFTFVECIIAPAYCRIALTCVFLQSCLLACAAGKEEGRLVYFPALHCQ